MNINGIDMEKACQEKMKAYIQEVEEKNNTKIMPEQMKNLENMFKAGFSAALEVLLKQVPGKKA